METGSRLAGVKPYWAFAKVYDYYLSIVVVWSLVPSADRLAARTVFVLLTFFGSEVCVITALVALDDVTGFRDGSDAINYGAASSTRRSDRKPLLAGSVSVTSAVRFGVFMAALGIAFLAVSLVLGHHRPAWAVV